MDIRYIETLLNKFWEATTTPEEENTLHVYFNSENVDPSLAYASVYFTLPEFSAVEQEDFSSKIAGGLIEKYFNAETSVEEEGIIRDYFAHGNIAPELKQYQTYFSLWNKQRTVTYNKELRLENASGHKKESTTKIIQFNWLKSVAAILVLAIAGTWIFRMQIENQKNGALASNAKNYIEVEDPELALKYTMEALALVSKKYKKGEEQLLEGMKTMNEANVLQ